MTRAVTVVRAANEPGARSGGVSARAEESARARARRFARAREGCAEDELDVGGVVGDARARGGAVVRLDDDDGDAREETVEVCVRAALASVVREETRRPVYARDGGDDGCGGWESVAVGARTMTLGGDGALYVGGGDGVVRRTRDDGGEDARYHPDLWCDDTFVNEGTAVRMIQMSRNGEEALVGYDNGAWTKFSLKNGLVAASSAPHEDFADIFKRVDKKKLSKYASTVPQCRSMIANDDLTKLYLASPVLRDSLVYAWDLTTAGDRAPAPPPQNKEERAFTSANVLQTNGLDEIDGVDAFDHWVETDDAGDAECSWCVPDGKNGTGDVKHLRFHSDVVTSLVRINSALISGSLDSHIAVWDLKSKEATPKAHSSVKMASAVRVMVASKDGRALYCAGADGSVRTFDVQGKSGKLTLQWARSIGGQDGLVTSLCGIKSEPFVIVGSAKQSKDPTSIIRGDGDLCMWRVTDGELMFKSTIHDADITSIVVSANGKTMYSGDENGKICKHVLGANVGERKKNCEFKKGFLL